MPMYATDYGLVESQMGQLAGEASLNRLRILDARGEAEAASPLVKEVEGSSITQDLRWSEMKYMMSDAGSEAPYLSILGYDTMEAVYGSAVFSESLQHIDAMRRGGHVVIAIASTRSSSLSALRQQAKFHIRFEDMAGSVMAAGMKPHTPYHYLKFDGADDRLPVPRMVPMI